MKLSQLRPCDSCGGQVTPIFYVVRYSIAVVNPRAVNTTMGLVQMFGGSLALAEAMTSEPEAVTIAMDERESQGLMTELFICDDCHVEQICLAELAERISVAAPKEEG